MRNFTLPIAASLLFILLALNVAAQKTLPPQEDPANAAARARCGTQEALERWFQQNPAAREQYLRNLQEGEKLAAQARESGSANESQRLQAIVTIPVVVHLVLPAADQAKVTTADVIWQINKLNEDFAGMNADSINATSFYGIRGHSQIRFCLATQDANGNPTNGINRVYSTITDFTAGTVGIIKHANSCGADAWDNNRYFNIWVAKSTSLLGIATFPNSGLANEQGIALALDGFSNNPAYVNPNFNLGRTAVHEAGHYFGLYHSWGDDGSACTGDDFRAIPGACVLPANLLLGDTPNQAGFTSGCPTGTRVDGCSGAAPGINYQNYMDYTDDKCYSMFTLKQVERAEFVLQNCRATLMGSNGCAPVTLFANDATAQLLSPGNSCYPGGSASTTFCQNTNFNASIMLRNVGTNNITSVKLNAAVGAGTVTTVNWTGNLAPFETVIVPINNINSGTTLGTQQLKVYTSDPNVTVDGRPGNDTAKLNLTVAAAGGGVTSVTQGFEATTFPPTGWTLINPAGISWTRTTSARNSGTASAYINSYNYTSTGHIDNLVAPLIDVTGADSVIIDFARAYKRYSTGTSSSDTLMVQLSTACGATTFPITAWKRGGDQLATVPGTTGLVNWFPAAGEWKREYFDIKPLIPAGTTGVQISFTSKNGYGQNQFLDDINIKAIKLFNRDATVRAVTSPLSKVCAGGITPAVEVYNKGKDTIKTLKVGYTIQGPSFTLTDEVNWTGSLALGQSTIVPLKPVTLPTTGVYTIRTWTKDPNGNTDEDLTNDTLAAVTFRYVPTVPLPLNEGFESATFPPANWARVNQDGQGTWFRTTVASRTGAASAVIDNYNYDAKGTYDDLETPLLSYNGIDSAYLTFNMSHATYIYPGSTGMPLDSLQVLVTKDCGQTFTVVYSKWGEDLQTVSNPNAPYTNLFVPTNANQWRTETVNLSQALGTSGTVQVIFRSKGNFGNTVLLDDVSITTKTLPARLKQQGYMIAPNPFDGSFTIQHYLRPANLRGVQITNSSGQVVYSRSFNGNADANMVIDLSRQAAGMYAVKLVYDNKVVTERVIKRGN